MKLFTIGDSISQGFMSGAAARTDQCYSTLIAKQLGIEDYHYPVWDKGGHPVNIEDVFRKLQRRLGTNIRGPIEWPRAINIISNHLDGVEDFYERGDGASDVAERPFHNVAVRGFEVSTAWQLTPEICSSYIEQSPGRRDNRFGMVDESLLRTARTVLSGGGDGQKDFSQIDWLNHHHQKEGVENLILFLGSNNALGTVLGLDIKQTSNDGRAFAEGPEKVSYEERRRNDWNLWHPQDFRAEYRYLINKVVEVMENNPHDTDYRVYVGTVPLVTIAPIIKAVGEMKDRENIKLKEWPVNQEIPAPMDESELPDSVEKDYTYAKYYTYFPFADNFKITDPHLNRQQVLHIDNCIRTYNRIIQEEVMLANKRLNARRFYLVDIGTVLSEMALKRNSLVPKYKFPEFFDFVYPRIDTRYYGTTRSGEIKSGGIFSLDGVHPTAIGQGLLAYEFLKVMKKAGAYGGDAENDLDWQQIFDSDSLYSQPIGLLGEIYDNVKMAKWVMECVERIKGGVKETK